MFKKIFSGIVSATTIAWSVGAGALALPSIASAATAGDLIKASGPAVYYYHTDGKRYVFPNEKTYFSWFKDFSSVKTISDSELASIFVGGNVTLRPGTYLAKVTTDPKVYAVSHDGTFHWIESEAIAKALYGDNWAQRVIDVPDAFFINYTVGTSVSTAVHPDGTVVSKDGSKWVIDAGKARMISDDSVFASNGYNAAFTIPTTIAYAAGSNVTAREGRLADVIFGAGTPVSGSVTVALASDTPAGMVVPKNASSVMLAKYNFTAGSEAATINDLRLRRVGVGATTDLSNVYLYDANGTRLTTGRTINSQTNEVEFNGLNISIAAGQTKSLVITGDFSSPTVVGGQHSFQVIDASAVMTGGVVSGSFPVAGNVFTVGTISAGRLDVDAGTTPTNPTLGATEAEISNFKLTANTNDIEVRRITLLQAGSVSNSDLTNFKLYTGGTMVASTASMSGDKIVLNFTAPYIITNGTTKTFSLKANVAGRTNRTVRTYVEYTTDIYAVDKLYNSGASVCIINTVTGCTTGSAGFDGSSAPNYIEVTTQGGSLSIAYNGPATQNIAKGSQDVTLFKFSIANSESDVEIRNMDFSIETPAGSVQEGGVEFFRDIKIKDLDTGLTWMGPVSYPAGVSNGDGSVDISLTDSRIIPAGKTMNLAITADLANSTDGNFIDNQFRVILGDGSNAIFGGADVRVQETSEFLSVSKIIPNSSITGNYMTVKESSLSVALAASPSASIAVKKQQMIPSAGFVLSAGAQSDVTVRALKLSGRGDTTGAYVAANLASVVTACNLYDGATMVGTTQSIDTTTGEIQISNMDVKIAQGTSKTLVVKCTADSTIAQGGGDNFAIGIANAVDIVAEDSDANTITPTLTAGVTGNAGAAPSLSQNVKDGGVVTISADNLRTSTILVADGTTWQNIAQYKASAQYEEVTIDRVRVVGTGDSASFASIAIAQNGVVKGEDVLSAGTNQSKDIVLSTPIIVPKDGSTTFQIWTKVAPVEGYASNGAGSGVARSGATIQAGLEYNVQTGEWDANYANKLNVRLIGSASGDRLYSAAAANIDGNEFVVRKTKPTATRQALSSTTLANTTQDLYKLQVSADAAGSVAVKEMTFDVAISDVGGAPLTLTNFRLRKGSSDVALADMVIENGAGADLEAGALAATGKVVVTFVNEETISGSGVVYTLYATVSGADAGESVSVTPTRDGTLVTQSGVITDLGAGGVAVDGTDGYFVWSDNSEVPHSSVLGGPSSVDWTNDVFVEDLTQTQALTR